MAIVLNVMGMCDCSLSTFERNGETTNVVAGNRAGEAWMTCIGCLQETVAGTEWLKTPKMAEYQRFLGIMGNHGRIKGQNPSL